MAARSSSSARGPTSASASAEQKALETNTELQKANAALEETKRYLSRLIDSSTDAIISTDMAGKIVFFSEGAEALLRYREDEILGRPATELYAGVEREERSSAR